MDSLTTILKKFHPIDLQDANRMKLLDRIDIKYIFPPDVLPEVLELLPEYYDLLITAKSGFSHYESHYLDTENYQMYLNHHNGLKNRNKVRFRRYLDSGTAFFEIKQKTNKSRTLKSRMEINPNELSINSMANAMLHDKTGYDARMLSESLTVRYNRISLISKNNTERVTIDTELVFDHSGKVISLPGIVIAEVKQPRSGSSIFSDVMHIKHILPLRISKYCLGMAAINPSLKRNNFKSKLLYVNRLSKDNV